jgi:chromosome segregation ATPase
MSPELSRLIIELTTRIQAAYDDADEAKADAAAVREQRQILLRQLHEADKRNRELQRRLYDLVESHRAMRARLANFEKVAA